MNETAHIRELIRKWMEQESGPGELRELEALIRSGIHDELIQSMLQVSGEQLLPLTNYDPAAKEAILRKIMAREPYAEPAEAPAITPVHFMRRWRWVAASIVLVLCAGAFFLFSPGKNEPAVIAKQTDIAPGTEGAVLTLGDGRQLVLDSLGNGVVAHQNGSQVVLQNGQLTYKAEAPASSAIVFNEMKTLRGRQFHMTLPDGTGVWLNAASSIRYPAVFAGKERLVEISGEVYFEVMKNKQMPFKVNVNNKASIEVLGTHFNVKAYDNEESLHTTLLEGSIKMINRSASGRTAAPKQELILQPGQQAQQAQLTHELKVVNDVDAGKVIAWKNGQFNFDQMSLKQAMREIERWYNIEVVYENGIPDVFFGGKLPKSLSLQELLSILEDSNIHFSLNGNKLSVSN